MLFLLKTDKLKRKAINGLYKDLQYLGSELELGSRSPNPHPRVDSCRIDRRDCTVVTCLTEGTSLIKRTLVLATGDKTYKEGENSHDETIKKIFRRKSMLGCTCLRS